MHFDGPIPYLGPGYHEGFNESTYSELHPVYKTIIERADRFIVRDSVLLDYLNYEFDTELLPCPGLLCSKSHR